jgi:hypothetical protein
VNVHDEVALGDEGSFVMDFTVDNSIGEERLDQATITRVTTLWTAMLHLASRRRQSLHPAMLRAMCQQRCDAVLFPLSLNTPEPMRSFQHSWDSWEQRKTSLAR